MTRLRPLSPSRSAPRALRLVLPGLALLAVSSRALAQFADTNPQLPASTFGCVLPGDYDHDGKTDVLVMGTGQHDIPFSTLYHNANGAFINSGIALPALSPSSTCGAQSAAWGDFDNDGDLDLAMTGLTASQVATTRVLRNNGSTFTVLPGAFTGVYAGAVTWADYDGDGDLDLLVTGLTAPQVGAPAATRLYRNDAGTFTSVAHPFPNAYVGPVSWVDYDGDGDLDVLICGADAGGGLTATLWRNQGGTFVDSGANLPGLDLGHATWGDYDGDGDLDLLFGGNSNAGFITSIYRNDAGVLVDINAGLLPVIWSAAAWGDYDNDGDLDAMVAGYDPAAQAARSILYQNNGGVFVDSGATFHDVYLGSVSWLDSDSDGDLDLLLFGNDVGNDVLRLYRNDLNTPPPPSMYCTAKVNSLGCVPALGSVGLPSVSSAAPFTIHASNVLNRQFGIFFYGYAQAATPFQGGFKCMANPTVRTPLQDSAGSALPSADCSGSYSFDFNAWIHAGSDPTLVVGRQVDGQFWSRDPASASTTGLTRAIHFVIGS